MATTFDLVVSCDDLRLKAAHETLLQAQKEVAQLESELSEFIESSPIAQLNRAPVGEKVTVPNSALELLELSQKLRLSTGGAFSPYAKSENPPIADCAFDAGSHKAWRTTEGTRVGFGAIGKGYAVDRIRSIVEREGFFDYWFSAGGSSLVLSGFSAPEEPWRWGWSWELNEQQEPMGLRLLHSTGLPVAIGVSGLHEKGKHLIDPRNGGRAESLKSAMVSTSSAAEADALSTALFVGGWDHGHEHFAELQNRPAMAVIDSNSIPKWNGVFQKLWGQLASFAVTFFLILSTISSFARADDSVDLNQLGESDFTPYLFERNRLWMLLPATILAIVLLHLIDSRPRRQVYQNPLEDHHEK